MSALDYPPPAHAGYIWYRGDALIVSFATHDGEGHTVTLPLDRLVVGRDADQRGWLVLLEVLRARHLAAQQARRPLIGTSEMPTRMQVEALLSGHRARVFDARGRERVQVGDLWEDEG
jgi:hypothetical protein